ncbi:MAG: DUF4175 family protein [Verrucomicrobiota bacterium]
MQPNDPSQQPVLDVLRRAGALHSRQRAMLLVLRSSVWLVAAIPLLMLADVLFHFSDPLRLAGGIGVVLVALTVIGVAVGVACFARPPLLRIARLLESRNPALGSKLVNILQLDADASREQAAPLTRELARRAVADAGKALDLPALPPLAREPMLPRRALHAVAAVGVLAMLTFFGGQHVRQEWLRFLDPYGDHPPFSLTYLEILKPADGDKVIYDGSVTVEVRASGHQPRELFFTAKPVDATAPAITVPMSARGDGTFVGRLETIRNPLEIVAHTGDGGSRSHRRMLGLVLTPQIGPAVVRIAPPAYTGQKAREIPYRFTALQVLEGTQVGFQLASNRPLGAGRILFEGGSDTPATFALQPAAEGPAETVHADFTAEHSGRMSFSLVDVAGNAATETPAASLTVTRDLPPAIAITVPEKDALVVDGLALPVMVDATDDYGLHSMRLHIGINDKFLPMEPVVFDAPDIRRHRIDHTLDLAKLGAKPGDKITVFAEAMDTRPEPQITRTGTRRMEVITEDDYNDRLREKVDVAMIAGKYEALLKRFEEQIAAQKRIEEKLAALQKEAANSEKSLAGLAEAFSEQHQLNQRLEQTADDMAKFGRDKPVYDFEKDLQEKLREQAAAIRESVEKNRKEGEQALESGPPPPEPPSVAMMEGLEKAAREQRERLQGGSDRAKQEIQEPLQDLARLHELMKDFNRFQQLTEEQRELAEQAKAYQDKPQLNAEDRLALRDLGARQRELAPKLDELAKKLRHDAEAAEKTFPEAAGSARELAGQMEASDMPGLARRAAQSMLDSKAGEAQAQANNLLEEMDRLFSDEGQQGQQGVAQGLDRALQLRRRMQSGDSLRQMMLSKNFRPLPGEGASGGGLGGFMANSMMDGEPQLLGGESLLDGPIASSIAGLGDQGGSGMPGAPTARLDQPDQSKVDLQSARRTATPGGSTLLLDYESIADAYFRRLTTKP